MSHIPRQHSLVPVLIVTVDNSCASAKTTVWRFDGMWLALFLGFIIIRIAENLLKKNYNKITKKININPMIVISYSYRVCYSTPSLKANFS